MSSTILPFVFLILSNTKFLFNIRFKGVFLIASGGISSIKDLEDLKEAGCEGAILGKAIYENKIELKSLMNFIEK